MIKDKGNIIILAGDPNSINSEILYKSWKKLDDNLKKKIYVIASVRLLNDQFKKLNYRIKINDIEQNNKNLSKNSINVIDIDIKFNNSFNIKEEEASKYVIKSLELGHKLARSNNVIGLINCPISKHLLKRKNFGVTEFLSKKNKLKKNSEVMLITNNNFSVSPITTHLELKNVSKKIKKNIIILKIQTIQKNYFKIFKRKPKIGILGLNPHNAELNNKSEEVKQIIPAINMLKKKGINIKGPLVADTVFIQDYKRFDIIVGMYHDQVLAPFKSIFKFDAINLTMGLNYLRVSPDHGVAKDIIEKNRANPLSLLKCIKFIKKFGK